MTAPATTFRLALNSSTLRHTGSTLPDQITATAAAGFAGFEPWAREIDAWVAQGGRIDDLAKQLRDARLEVVNLIGFFEWAVDDPAVRARGLEEARRHFALAAALGCRLVAAPPFGIHRTPGVALDHIAARYAALIDAGRDFGVVPVLEFWGIAASLGSLEDALHVLNRCGRPAARVLADVFHIFKSGARFETLAKVPAGAMGLFHLNDYRTDRPAAAQVDADRVYPGTGDAPLTEILRTLAGGGNAGWLSLELFPAADAPRQPVAEAARYAHRMMQAAVTAAGG